MQRVEESFGRRLRDDWLPGLQSPSILLSATGRAAAVVIEGIDGIAYLDKFVVTPDAQGEGPGRGHVAGVACPLPHACTGARATATPSPRWYFQQADTSERLGPWVVFSNGIEDYEQRERAVRDAMARDSGWVEEAAHENCADRRTWLYRCGIAAAWWPATRGWSWPLPVRPASPVCPSRRFAPSGPTPPRVSSRCELDNLAGRHADVWVLAVPNGVAASWAAAISDHDPDAVILDLSADHRFDPDWVYGLPEHNREQVLHRAQRLPTPAAMPRQRNWRCGRCVTQLDGVPVVFGVSGYSGAGKTPSAKNDPTRLADNLMPYALAGHVHERKLAIGCSARCASCRMWRPFSAVSA